MGTIRDNPVLLFCIVFVITMGVAIGLASSNLGTLSRYRMPMMPFFAALLFVLTAKPATQPLNARLAAVVPKPTLT
jgi:hypothetical protein